MGIGAVLSQVDTNGQEQVIAYGSRLLTKPERHYCTTRKELLAVVVFTQQYRPYLLGRNFTLRTDHGSLTWLQNFRDPQGQLARWLERLQEFNYSIVHHRGKKHTNADALSRLPGCQCGRVSDEVRNATVIHNPIHPAEGLRRAQLADPMVGPLLQGREKGCKLSVGELGSTSRKTRRRTSLK